MGSHCQTSSVWEKAQVRSGRRGAPGIDHSLGVQHWLRCPCCLRSLPASPCKPSCCKVGPALFASDVLDLLQIAVCNHSCGWPATTTKTPLPYWPFSGRWAWPRGVNNVWLSQQSEQYSFSSELPASSAACTHIFSFSYTSFGICTHTYTVAHTSTTHAHTHDPMLCRYRVFSSYSFVGFTLFSYGPKKKKIGKDVWCEVLYAYYCAYC